LPPAAAGGIVNYAQRKHQPVSSEKRKSEIAVHGLKPKTNPKSGSTDAEKDDNVTGCKTLRCRLPAQTSCDVSQKRLA